MGWFSSSPKPASDKAKYRGDPPAAGVSLLGDLVPPNTSQARSSATEAALAAQKRARKRAGAGASTLLTGQPLGAGNNPAAVLTPKTLVGY